MKAKLDFLVSEYQPITREGYARHVCISEFECHHPHFVLFNLFSNPPSLSLAREPPNDLHFRKKKKKERRIVRDETHRGSVDFASQMGDIAVP